MSGVMCAEEAGSGTTTGRRFSFGNGDEDSYAVLPFDAYIVAISVTSGGSCGGTATVRLDTNGTTILSSAVTHTGTEGSYLNLSSAIGPLPAGTRICANRTAGCSSGGDGMVVCWYWIADYDYAQIDSLRG